MSRRHHHHVLCVSLHNFLTFLAIFRVLNLTSYVTTPLTVVASHYYLIKVLLFCLIGAKISFSLRGFSFVINHFLAIARSISIIETSFDFVIQFLVIAIFFYNLSFRCLLNRSFSPFINHHEFMSFQRTLQLPDIHNYNILDSLVSITLKSNLEVSDFIIFSTIFCDGFTTSFHFIHHKQSLIFWFSPICINSFFYLKD